MSLETKKKISESKKGWQPTDEWRLKQSVAHTGKKHSIESRKKMSLAQMGNKKSLGHKKTDEYKKNMSENRKGDKGSNWRGGITPINKTIHHSLEYRVWRESVFKRDDYTCQKYKTRGKRLHAHHMLNFSKYPELRFDINNGVTLSIKAHNEFHKIYGKTNNTKEQLFEFISETEKCYE